MKFIFDTPDELIAHLSTHGIPFSRRSEEMILVSQNSTRFCFCMNLGRMVINGVGAGGLQISVSQLSYDSDKPQYLSCEDNHRIIGSILFGSLKNDDSGNV